MTGCSARISFVIPSGPPPHILVGLLSFGGFSRGKGIAEQPDPMSRASAYRADGELDQ